MINTVLKTNLVKIGQEGGGSTSIWIMSVNIPSFFNVTPQSCYVTQVGLVMLDQASNLGQICQVGLVKVLVWLHQLGYVNQVSYVRLVIQHSKERRQDKEKTREKIKNNNKEDNTNNNNNNNKLGLS